MSGVHGLRFISGLPSHQSPLPTLSPVVYTPSSIFESPFSCLTLRTASFLLNSAQFHAALCMIRLLYSTTVSTPPARHSALQSVLHPPCVCFHTSLDNPCTPYCILHTYHISLPAFILYIPHGFLSFLHSVIYLPAPSSSARHFLYCILYIFACFV